MRIGNLNLDEDEVRSVENWLFNGTDVNKNKRLKR